MMKVPRVKQSTKFYFTILIVLSVIVGKLQCQAQSTNAPGGTDYPTSDDKPTKNGRGTSKDSSIIHFRETNPPENNQQSTGPGPVFNEPFLDPNDWIRGREPNQKLNLISWLIDGCFLNVSGISNTKNIEQCTTPHDGHPSEIQTFDGFFNNIFKTDLGAVDTPLLRRVPPVYDDGVYLPVTKNRINPFAASDLMNRTQDNCVDSKESPCGSRTGKTALLVFFGQQLVEEILDVQRAGCPPEYFNIEIPKDHTFHKNSPYKTQMPLLRSRYAQNTGQSPGNPRQQLNEITPWFDGGLVYGTAKGWADVLRTRADKTLHPKGQLASENNEGYFPVVNSIRLPLANPPPPARHCHWTKNHHTANVNRFFVLGNPRGNENAFLLTFGVVLFRWHNQIATYFETTRPHWSGERIFNEARKWVIATHQSIVYYNWLSEWLGDGLGNYPGYDPSVDPQIEHFFQTAAMRFGHTLVTPGAYMRDYACSGCDQVPFPGVGHDDRQTYTKERFQSNHSVRTCNIFWRPQEPLTMKFNNDNTNCKGDDAINSTFADIDRLLMGMASQRAEREDNMIVEDLRGNVFGSLEFSRRDLMTVNIQRGRDHGTPDYNTARESFNLTRICSVDQFILLNGLNETASLAGGNKDIRQVIENLEKVHRGDRAYDQYNNATDPNCWDNIDVWTGGILETNKNRPGPLFRAIIKDQLQRIRIADRFWFENTQWKKPRFDAYQIDRIKKLKIYDLLVSVTRMKDEDIQRNPFSVPDEKFVERCKPGETTSASGGTEKLWRKSTCWTPDRQNQTTEYNRTCYHLPQLHTEGNSVEDCTEPGTYDYFSGSQFSYIFTFICIGLFIIGVFFLVPFVGANRQQKKTDELAKLKNGKTKKVRATMRKSGQKGRTYLAREWQGRSEGYRAVIVVLVDDTMILDLRNHDGDLLRHIDFTGRTHVDVTRVPKPGAHLVLKTSNEYDCVLDFESTVYVDDFYSTFQEKFDGKLIFREQEIALKQAMATATTKQIRQARLELFFRSVFARAFDTEKRTETEAQADSDIIRGDIATEITKTEFAEALSMSPSSKFVEKMFALVDRDGNGFISFREFLDMLVIFAKGDADAKAKLMFDMYDIRREGKLTKDEFKEMIRSLIDAANADVELTNEKLDATVESILSKAQLKPDSSITLADFQRLLSQHKETLGYAQLNFAGQSVPIPKGAQQGRAGARATYIETARGAVTSIYGEGMLTDSPAPAEPTDQEETLTTTEKRKGNTWFEVNRLQIFWGSLYTLVVISVFAERAYYYSVEREHGGLRHIAGYGVTVTRGAASVMMFCYATLLLTMCRNTITHLRETFLHHYIPFDSFVLMHKFIALIGLLFTIIHIIGHSINFYHISTQTASDLACLFRDFFRPTHVLPKFHYWCFQTVTGITGILLVLQATLIYAFSSNYARANAFQMFWIAHNSYPLFYILMLIHGSGRLVQDPIFYTFLIGPLVLFILDRLITTSRKKVEIPVLRAEILPSNVTLLEFARPSGFDYKSGQWVRIACTSISANEFHPFTLSSAPHERNLTLHIRAVGPFTANIRQIYGRTKNYASNAYPKLFLEGPYGEGHQDWWRYEVSVLVGGGIGVTPFASILKDVANHANPRSCKKIYFMWVTRTQKQFEWLVDIIREVENHKIIAIHIFITQTYDKFDLRTVLLYICERHFQKVSNQSLFTGLKSVTHFGRPNFPSFFKSLRKIHPKVDKFGVFSCGPLPMTKRVDEACWEANDKKKDAKGIFQHHFENF